MKRGKLAKLTGCNSETIRYYESAGLLPEPPRTEAGHRVYDDQHVRRLSFILRARNLGFTVKEIGELLSLSDDKTFTCAQVQGIAARHLSDVQERIADLRRIENVLQDMLSQCKDGTKPECPILDSLYKVCDSSEVGLIKKG